MQVSTIVTVAVVNTAFFLIQFQTVCAQNTDPVAAVVGDTKIHASQVDHLFAQKFAKRDLDPKLVEHLRARVLEQLVDQQIVVQFLGEFGNAANDDEVNLEINRLAERLKKIDKTLSQFLKERGLTRDGLEYNYRWQISWKRYLNQHLTDENLGKYFSSNRRQFDGTELHLAHLLVKLEHDATEADVKKTIDRVVQIREKIVSNQITWQQAVKQHSSAPTKDRAGDIGWIKRSGPMPNNFTDSAFELEENSISEPVRTNFGVHLIKCLEVRNGTASWYDVRPQLEDAATGFLFNRILEKQSGKVDVQYTGATPYIDRKNGKVIAANK